MRAPAMLALGATLALAASYACGNAHSESASAVDAAADSVDTTDAAVSDETECNPCFQFCACTPGESVFSPGACTTYTCPASGVWGGQGCTGASRCDGGDAQAGAIATDGPADAPREATGDAPEDSTKDAPEDSPEDAPEGSTPDASE